MFIFKRNFVNCEIVNLEEVPLHSEVIARKSYASVASFLKGFWEFSNYYGRFIAYR